MPKGTSGGKRTNNKQVFTKGDIRYIVSRNSRGLYDYQSQEYSATNKKWVNMSKQVNFSREAIEDWLDIRLGGVAPKTGKPINRLGQANPENTEVVDLTKVRRKKAK